MRTRVNQIRGAGAREMVDAYAAANRQLKMTRVQFKIVRHLILSRERERRTRKFHSGQAVEHRRREQTERIPTAPPHLTDARTRVENDKRPSLAGQVIPDRQTGLPAANHDRVEPFARISCAMFTSPRSIGEQRRLRIDRSAHARACDRWVFLCRRRVQSVLERVRRCGSAARNVEFQENVGHVSRDRLFADLQRVADAPIRPARGNESQDLQFAGGQTCRVMRDFSGRAQTGEIKLRAELLERPARGIELEIGAVLVAERSARLRNHDLRAGRLLRHFQLAPECQRGPA